MTEATSARRCGTCNARLAWDNTDTLCSPCRKSHAGALGPPSVPPRFWESADLQTALADWHIGRVLRAYRHHPLHGPRPVPQEVVAGWLGITQTQVSRVESGSAITDLDKLTLWAQTLGIPAQYLWFQLPDERPAPDSGTASAAHASLDSTTLARRETVEEQGQATAEGGEDTRRKDFLVLAGTSLANLLAPPLIHGWREQPAVQMPELDDLLVAQLRAQTEGYRWLDRQRGAAQLLPSTARHARTLANFWRLTDDRHRLRNEVGEIAADACHLVAYQAFDQGKRTQATEWYRCSAELAAQVGAQDLYVFAMCGVAYMHARNGDRELALSVLHQLEALPLSAAARCYIAVYEAHGHAAYGQPDPGQRDAALRTLELATVLATQTRNEAPSPWLGIPDVSFVDRQRALVLARLGDPRTLSVLRHLDQQTPAVFQRYKVTLTSNFALTYAHMSEVEQAADYLATAVRRNQQTHSEEKTTLILEARRVLDPHRDSQAVRAIDELLHDSGVRALSGGLS